MILFILPVSLFAKTSESVSFNPVQIQHLCSYTSDMSHAGCAFGRSPSWLLSPTHWPPFRGLGASMLIDVGRWLDDRTVHVLDLGSRLPSCKEGKFLARSNTFSTLPSQLDHWINMDISWFVCMNILLKNSLATGWNSWTPKGPCSRDLVSIKAPHSFGLLLLFHLLKYPEHQNIVFLEANSPKTCYVSSWMSSDGILSMKKFNCARDCACLLSPQ